MLSWRYVPVYIHTRHARHERLRVQVNLACGYLDGFPLRVFACATLLVHIRIHARIGVRIKGLPLGQSLEVMLRLRCCQLVEYRQ